MADREVAWGDEEEEVISVPVVAATPVKKEKEPLPVPEWSIDTRADLPMEQAVSYSAAPVAASAPSWPEEETNYTPAVDNNNGHNNASMNELPPLTRRIGRDPVPNGNDRPGRGDRGFDRNDRNGDSRPPRTDRPPRARLDDLSTLNLPGVDLSKMPQATTRLSFSNGRNGDDRPRREERRDERREERRGGYESVNRVTKEVEEFGWGEPEQVPAARAEFTRAAPVETSRNEELSWGDEPEVTEPARAEPARVEPAYKPQEPVRAEPVAEPVYKPQAASEAPVKVANSTARLDDDGWGDEPEEVYVPAAPKAAEPVKFEPIRVTSPTGVPQPIRVSEPVKAVTEPVKAVTEPVKSVAKPTAEPIKPATFNVTAAPYTAPMPSSTSSEQLPVHAHPMMMSPYGAAQMPYMMNPMSPVGQMPMPPMSMMPGMMMPIWVTCPFCYHCYMYPPVAPGAGPAPGAAQIPSAAATATQHQN